MYSLSEYSFNIQGTTLVLKNLYVFIPTKTLPNLAAVKPLLCKVGPSAGPTLKTDVG